MNRMQQKYAELRATDDSYGKYSPTVAAVLAGYKRKSARVMAWKLERNEAVRLEIARIKAGAPRLVDLLPKDATPLEYLKARMNDPYVSTKARARAAIAAAPYLHAKRGGE